MRIVLECYVLVTLLYTVLKPLLLCCHTVVTVPREQCGAPGLAV
jgi:hypothetical protein